MNNNYKNIEDFLQDVSFHNWVHQKNEADIDKWENWLIFNEEKKELVNDAKVIIQGIQFNPDLIAAVVVEQEWEKNEAYHKQENPD